ncbi:hypothetical protein FPRO03_03446 [Fusarium proliferatum]|nr:hypothetical protein FPRO03_03446 [Fusarium proliferatum]
MFRRARHMSKKAFCEVWSYVRHPRKISRLLWSIPKLIWRSAYTTWDGKTITYGHLVLLIIWLVANVVIDLDWRLLTPLGPPAKRAALAAILNLIPVVLGGRTCHVADFLGISLQFYYLLHHWMARISLLQSFVHAGIHIRLQESWTTMSGMGVAAVLLFIIITFLSIFYVRRKYTVAFIWCHRILACSLLGFLLAHLWLVYPLDRRIAGIILLCVIGISTLLTFYRWLRLQKAQVDISRCHLTVRGPHAEEEIYTGATRVKIRPPRDTPIYPGAYFYVFNEHDLFWRRCLGTPMVVYEWTTSTSSSVNKCSASDLTFLMEDHPSLAPLLPGTRLTIDGPYGRNLRLDRYDQVFLLAEGIGIASVISFAFTLAHRRLHDREKKPSVAGGSHEQLFLDKTRRVTLIWAMEENSQLEWARTEINRLMKLDPLSKLLHVWLYQPKEPDPTLSFPRLEEVQKKLEACDEFPKHCRVTYAPKNCWSEVLRQQLTGAMETSPGTIAAAVCGTPAFRHMARDIINEHARAKFYELEHQPMPRQKPAIVLSDDMSRQLSVQYRDPPANHRVVQQVTQLNTEESMSVSVIVEEEYEMRSMSQKRQLA